MKLGTTFSHRYAAYIGLDAMEALDEVLGMNFDLLRICSYWKELEPVRGQYRFEPLQAVLDACEKKGQNVILTVGEKAPHVPEYHAPEWANSLASTERESCLLDYLRWLRGKIEGYACIRYIQIENEPFDPTGRDMRVQSDELVRHEIEIFEPLGKELVITLWANDMLSRTTLLRTASLVPIIGLDTYFFVPQKRFFTTSIKPKLPAIAQGLAGIENEIWVTELQAEPWERGERFSRSENPASISPSKIIENLESVKVLNPSVVLFWGVEYWLWREKYLGDIAYVEAFLSLRASALTRRDR